MRAMPRLPAVGLAAVSAVAAFVAQPAEAATQPRQCAVDQVAVIDGRIHIRCAPDVRLAYTREITFYAMPLTEPAVKIDAVISLAIAAKQLPKPLVLWFDMDDYRSVPGCLGHNCRRLHGVALE